MNAYLNKYLKKLKYQLELWHYRLSCVYDIGIPCVYQPVHVLAVLLLIQCPHVCLRKHIAASPKCCRHWKNKLVNGRISHFL